LSPFYQLVPLTVADDLILTMDALCLLSYEGVNDAGHGAQNMRPVGWRWCSAGISRGALVYIKFWSG